MLMVLSESLVMIAVVNKVEFVTCQVVMLLVLIAWVLLVVLAVLVECRSRVRRRVPVSTNVSWICPMVKSVVLVVLVELVV